MRYHVTLKSANHKTGPIPVTTTTSDSCPKTCGMYHACYAKSGPLAIHWRALDAGRRGITLKQLCKAIAALPAGQLWRHNQAGDLPGQDSRIDARALDAIVTANSGRRGFTYTHKPLTRANVSAIRNANSSGFTVNISTDSLAQADNAKALGAAPVVTVLPQDVRHNIVTPAGNLVVVCPAATHPNVTCASCKLCA